MGWYSQPCVDSYMWFTYWLKHLADFRMFPGEDCTKTTQPGSCDWYSCPFDAAYYVTWLGKHDSNLAPEKPWWLEDDSFPFGARPIFRSKMVLLGRVNIELLWSLITLNANLQSQRDFSVCLAESKERDVCYRFLGGFEVYEFDWSLQPYPRWACHL